MLLVQGADLFFLSLLYNIISLLHKIRKDGGLYRNMFLRGGMSCFNIKT